MRVLFLDCFSGISGDMMVGALCDLGVKPSTFEWELSKLGIGDFHMHFERAKRREIEGVKFGIHEGSTHVHDEEEHDQHEHAHGEHEHAHGEHEHAHGEHEHAHGEHEHAHGEHDHAEHDHVHSHGDDEHGHVHGRSHADIVALIENSDLSDFVKQKALGIFHRVAVAEAKIHGVPVETVGFHEVGALDSIADVVLTCVGLEELGVEKVFCGSLSDGHGWIDCAHGRFPVPAPATLEILQGVPLGQMDEPHEMITPTGAAIAKELAESFGPMPRLKIEKVGYGLGTRELASRPNVLRAVLGELVVEE